VRPTLSHHIDRRPNDPQTPGEPERARNLNLCLAALHSVRSSPPNYPTNDFPSFGIYDAVLFSGEFSSRCGLKPLALAAVFFGAAPINAGPPTYFGAIKVSWPLPGHCVARRSAENLHRNLIAKQARPLGGGSGIAEPVSLQDG
jgi:hypothetical protein